MFLPHSQVSKERRFPHPSWAPKSNDPRFDGIYGQGLLDLGRNFLHSSIPLQEGLVRHVVDAGVQSGHPSRKSRYPGVLFTWRCVANRTRQLRENMKESP